MVRSIVLAAALMLATGPTQAQVTRLPTQPGQARVSAVDPTTVQRFPSVVSPFLGARQAAPPRATWRINPAQTQLQPQTQVQIAPQTVANRIAQRLQVVLPGSSVGFSATVMMPGGEFASANSGRARAAVDAPARDWTANDRISVASVSKPITAAAVIRLAAQRGVSLDTAAWTLLPTDWYYSSSFKTITVRELLAHTSGIRDCNITHVALQLCAMGNINPADKGTGPDYATRYENANYALLRIILTEIADGSIQSTALGIGQRYVTLVNQQVIGPAVMGSATCAASGTPALSYVSTTDDGVEFSNAPGNFDWLSLSPGNNWGDMTEVCGSQGWTLSSRQLATFANALLVSDRILPRTTVDTMQSEGLGLQYFDFGQGLTAFGHGGYHPGPSNGGELRTLILTFNNGVSVGLLVNSRYYLNSEVDDVAEAVRNGWWF